MYRAVLCLLVVVAASAAPYYDNFDHFGPQHGYHHRHSPDFHESFMEPHHHHHQPYNPSEAFGHDMFDARRFWMDLSREMMSIEMMMQDLYRRFPMRSSTAGFVDGKYKITIPIEGFEEKEIAVKAKDTVLMIQAVHKGEVSKTYIDARALPGNVDAKGTWTYDGKTLVIIFPIKENTEGENTDNTSNEGSTDTETNENRNTGETETTNADASREEMDLNPSTDNDDADVGLRKTQQSAESEDIETNFIPTQSPVEATTYAVDLTNEVEFVPVKY